MRVLWLAGPSGAGKSTIAWRLFERLRHRGAVAFFDADQVALALPAPSDDPDQHELKADAAAAVVATFADAGVRGLVISGGMQSDAHGRQYRAALRGVDLLLVRLRVEEGTLRQRYLARRWRPDLVEENAATAVALEESSFADAVLDTTDLTVDAAVEAVSEVWTSARSTGSAASVGGPDRGTGDRVGGIADVAWITGPPRVGSSTVGWEVLSLAAAEGRSAALVDVRQFEFVALAGVDGAVAAAVRALVRTHSRHGVGTVFLNGWAAPSLRAAIESELGAIPVVRLRAIRRRARSPDRRTPSRRRAEHPGRRPARTTGRRGRSGPRARDRGGARTRRASERGR